MLMTNTTSDSLQKEVSLGVFSSMLTENKIPNFIGADVRALRCEIPDNGKSIRASILNQGRTWEKGHPCEDELVGKRRRGRRTKTNSHKKEGNKYMKMN